MPTEESGEMSQTTPTPAVHDSLEVLKAPSFHMQQQVLGNKWMEFNETMAQFPLRAEFLDETQHSLYAKGLEVACRLDFWPNPTFQSFAAETCSHKIFVCTSYRTRKFVSQLTSKESVSLRAKLRRSHLEECVYDTEAGQMDMNETYFGHWSEAKTSPT